MLDIAQDKYFAIFLSERAERRKKFLADFLPLKRFRRNLAPVRKIAWRVRAVFVFLILDRSHNFQMTLPLPLARFIDRHLNQPGAEPRFGPELREIFERFQERVLRRILRFGFVPQNRERDYKDTLLVRPYQIVEQLLFAPLDAPNKGSFLLVMGSGGATSNSFRFDRSRCRSTSCTGEQSLRQIFRVALPTREHGHKIVPSVQDHHDQVAEDE